MAALTDLINQVEDATLRERLLQEAARLTKQKKFGLVFEEHIPECTPLYGITIKRGSTVSKKAGVINDVYRVIKITGDETSCIRLASGESEMIALSELVPVAQFGEPIYPTLQPIDRVENAPDSDLWHTLIEADNYHALQLLEYLYPKQVDCIYIDPPYNTGARDWKYNNDYVDSSDSWRHSKWLSMMQKRLKIAKRILNPQKSILIVTIDQNELHHLACLLEELFPDAVRQTVTICISPSGSSGDGLSRVEEYALFCFLGEAKPAMLADDLLLPDSDKRAESIRWESLMRGGTSWYRSERPNLCYPVILSDDGTKIIGTGNPLPFHNDDVADRLEEENRVLTDDQGHPYAWPLRTDGRLGIWRVDSTRLNYLASYGYIYVSSRDNDRGTFTLRYILEGTITEIEAGTVKKVGTGSHGEVLLERQSSKRTIPKTMWMRNRHTAGGAGGTKLITDMLCKRNVFSFPKSVYSEKDAIAIATVDNPNALIVDFFAGSGTTLHAVNLLNAEDGGHRRCIMVTNNEVSSAETKALSEQGYQPGDPEWEKLGIARYVTWPRTVCSIEGHDVNGNALTGNYLGSDIPMADGFAANCEYFKLGFLDKNDVAMGRQFAEILPLLWLKAGAVCKRPEFDGELPEMMILPKNKLAVLVNESSFMAFAEQLDAHADIDTVFIVTDSERAYREMISGLKAPHTYQLYRSYLDNFRINARR